jgi:DUF1009 family protein
VANSLGLIAGAGQLPGRVAEEARRQGWRIVALVFGDAPGLDGAVDRLVPCRLSALGVALETIRHEGIKSVVFSGTLRKPDLIHALPVDSHGRRFLAGGGKFTDASLNRATLGLLEAAGVQVLDQRMFLGPLLASAGVLTARTPTDAQWEDIAGGLRLARQCAAFGVGQTVVIRSGAVVAIEALEGTDEAIRRGCRLGGPGAVVVKAVSPQHDYRFDIPTVGEETIAAMVSGQAAALALESGKILCLDREAVVERANRQGITIVGVDPGRLDLP